MCSQWASDQLKPKLVLSSIPQKVINIYCHSHSYYQRVVNKPWTCSQSDEWTNHLCQLPYCRDLAAHMHTQLAVCIISSICCLRLCIRYILCTNIMCVCVYLHYDMHCVYLCMPAMLLARLASESVKSLARTVFNSPLASWRVHLSRPGITITKT